MANLLSALALGLAAVAPASARPQQGGPPAGGPPAEVPGGPPAGGPPAGGPPQAEIVGSPEYTEKYHHPLWRMDTAQISYTEEIDGRTIDYYELNIEAFQEQIYNGLEPANLVGFNGTSPGPTFRVQRGHETVVRINNNHDEASNLHLHGSPNHAVWDGWAHDLIQPGQYKDYYFPNYESARPIWYHGHRDQLTADDAYLGQAGAYIIEDSEEDKLGLPKDDYDQVLILSDKIYQENGDVAGTRDEVFDFFGDVIHVNERPWPYFDAEPRKYRLRLFDFSLSRPYDLYFEDPDGEWVDFKVVGSDSGLFGHPVDSNDVTISPGERYEIVIDFAGREGQEIHLRNKARTRGAFEGTDEIMKFVVLDTVTDTTNNGDVPDTLNSNIIWPEARDNVDRTFNFQLGGDDVWTINGISFGNADNRVLANPQQGAVELWEFRHTGGPAVHPVHVHLVEFQVISRTGGDRGVLPYESAGMKDIVLLQPGEVVQALAYFGPWHGVYMFHCHNLIHEDNAMMVAYNVSRLPLLGYDENTTALADPMSPDFAAHDQPGPAPSEAVADFAALDAYADPYALEEAQKSWYSENGGFPAATPVNQEETVAPSSSGAGFAFPHDFAPTPTPDYRGRDHWASRKGGDWRMGEDGMREDWRGQKGGRGGGRGGRRHD